MAEPTNDLYAQTDIDQSKYQSSVEDLISRSSATDTYGTPPPPSDPTPTGLPEEGSDQVPTSISKDAQNIARATGNNYSALAKSQEERGDVDFKDYDSAAANEKIATEAKMKDGLSYVDQAKSTVQGQMTDMLSKDSEYIKLNELQAMQKAAGRGALNSSMAARMGQLAAIQSALPIAQQDAKTYSQAQAAQQQAEYGQNTIKTEAIVSAGLVEQRAGIEQKQADLQNSFQAKMTGLSEQSKIAFQDFQNKFNKGMQQLEQAHQTNMLGMELDHQQALAMAEQTSAIMQNYQISVENMLSDPDFLKLGTAAVNNNLAQVKNLAANSINMLGSVQGVNTSNWVNTYLKTLSFSAPKTS